MCSSTDHEWQPAIFRVYNRKVAEHAQLFPIFHTFETAFRSTIAVTLEEHYRHARWWRPIYKRLRRGAVCDSGRSPWPRFATTARCDGYSRDSAGSNASARCFAWGCFQILGQQPPYVVVADPSSIPLW
jgi:hypothetical protein